MQSEVQLDLPRRLLWGSAVVSLLALLVAATLATWRAERDVRQEMQAAMDLALVLQRAHALTGSESALTEEQAVQWLREATGERSLRHLAVTLRDDTGRRMWSLSAAEPASSLTQWVVDLHRRWQVQADPAPVLMQLSRPDGAEWSLVVSPSPDSERRKAVVALMQLLALLAAATLALLLVMGLQIRWLLRPMSMLLGAMAQMRAGRHEAAADLPQMPLRELQSVADALRELGSALQGAEQDRRMLAQRMLTLQEDERRHIAQELHDELGQRLTALRLDASVLQRTLGEGSQAQAIAQGLVTQARQAQGEVRQLLQRLAPHAQERQPVQRLHELLATLHGLRSAAELPEVELHCEPGEGELPTALIMAVFRLSQEALTNAWRHAGASRVLLSVRRRGFELHWSCVDDGAGIDDLAAAFRRGNGLAGMRQRVWAFGGDLQLSDARPGLRLEAILRIPMDSD